MLDVIISKKDDPIGLVDCNTNIILFSSELLQRKCSESWLQKQGNTEFERDGYLCLWDRITAKRRGKRKSIMRHEGAV